MAVQIMLHISDDLYQQYLLLAQMIGRDVAELINDRLEGSGQMGFEQLSDSEVLCLADAKMPADQAQRLHTLLERNGEGELNTAEIEELDRLMAVYDTGNLLKVQGALEAVRRGLRALAAS